MPGGRISSGVCRSKPRALPWVLRLTHILEEGVKVLSIGEFMNTTTNLQRGARVHMWNGLHLAMLSHSKKADRGVLSRRQKDRAGAAVWGTLALRVHFVNRCPLICDPQTTHSPVASSVVAKSNANT